MQKLTKNQKMHLINEYASTNISQQELAVKYNVSLRRVQQLVKGIRRYRDHKNRFTWSVPATRGTEGGNQKFHRNYKEYSYYENDDFWRIKHMQHNDIYSSELRLEK